MPGGLAQVKQLALRALKTVPEAGKHRQPFVRIKQETNKPFMKFLGRLNEALEKQIDYEQAREYIFKQLAVENANPDCQKVLQPLRNPSIGDMLNACMNVGSRQRDLSVIAEAFAALSLKSQQCFLCGQYGHLRKDCLKLKQNNKRPGICPRCQKGPHFPNQYRSKFDRNGQPLTLPGNSKRSVARVVP